MSRAYFEPGIKFNCPKGFRIDYDLRVGLWIEHKKKDVLRIKKKDVLRIKLLLENDEISQGHRFVNPDKWKTKPDVEIFRHGEHPKFVGSKEILLSNIRHLGSGKDKKSIKEINWYLLIPVGNHLVMVQADVDEDPETIDFIKEAWESIVNSIEFDIDEMNKVASGDIVEPPMVYNWTRKALKPRHFNYEFVPEYSYVGFHNSSIDLFLKDADGSSFDDMEEISEILIHEARFIKKDKRFFISPERSDFNVPASIYLHPNQPNKSEKGFDHIIEGTIGLESGTLLAATGVAADDGPDFEVKLKEGVYKFRVYFSGLMGNEDDDDYDEDKSESWKIYFWPTDEKETNEIKIIKPWNKPKFDD